MHMMIDFRMRFSSEYLVLFGLVKKDQFELPEV